MSQAFPLEAGSLTVLHLVQHPDNKWVNVVLETEYGERLVRPMPRKDAPACGERLRHYIDLPLRADLKAVS
ncbi:MAG TPA: hypothetical protein VM493_07885 [Vicinamibacterales bacterium]|nr:hypothetical protein [Vicinamibacterales bacterium]